MDIIDTLAGEIVIDGSYVNFPENKHIDTFLMRGGWRKFCELILESDFGRNTTSDDRKKIIEIYNVMLISYML